MFYTGATLTPEGNVQRIGFATSEDLMTWRKNPDNPVLQADPRWYERLADGMWPDEAFRDPWVLPDPDGDGWHMLFTARANHGPADDRGVIGHAWSPDLRSWELRPPLTEPGQGFGQLEVVQTAQVDGQEILMFSALAKDMSKERAVGTTGGVWVAKAETLLGPYDIAGAQQLTNSDLYVGRLITDRQTGETKFLAFRHDAHDGTFIGEIDEPQNGPLGRRRSPALTHPVELIQMTMPPYRRRVLMKDVRQQSRVSVTSVSSSPQRRCSAKRDSADPLDDRERRRN